MPALDILRLGRARLRENFLSHADRIFRRFLTVNPEYPTALHLLGITQCKLGRPEEGADLIRRAARQLRERADIRFDLAAALRQAGRHAEADVAYDEGLAVASATPDSRIPPRDALAFSVERGAHRFRFIDYRYRAAVRYGAGRPPHQALSRVIERGRGRYAAFIDQMAALPEDFDDLADVANDPSPVPQGPNAMLAPLDALALAAVLRTRRPSVLVEVGSGVATAFARRTIDRHRLGTRIVSIDPKPNADIDSLVAKTIRLPLDKVGPGSFDGFRENDLLFVDSSHRAFQNSDVTTLFLDILPRLKPGVIVQLHDIYLPYDYPVGMLDRLWNEQFFLAALLLYGGGGWEVLFPCWYASQDADLSARLNARLRRGRLGNLCLHGGSFWLRKIAAPGR
jgi:tetratricopeptide (TPR) repeat protein